MSKFLSMIPLAIELAKIAEAAVPLSGQGSAKLAFAVNAAASIYETQEDLRSSWKDKTGFLEAFSQAVSTAVRLMNAAGVFKK